MPRCLQRNIQPGDFALVVEAQRVAQLRRAAGKRPADQAVHQHFAGALLHVEHFDPQLIALRGVLHPLRNGLRADLILAFIEHVGILGKKTADATGITRVGRVKVRSDRRGQCRAWCQKMAGVWRR